MKKQVSVITGWAFCHDDQLLKFAQLHEKFGNDAICLNMPGPLLLNYDLDKQRQYAQNGINQIKDKFGAEVDLVFHNLSTNGFNLFGHMESIIRKDPELCIKGMILDSCPSPNTFFTSWLVPLMGWKSYYLKPNKYLPIMAYAYLTRTELGYGLGKAFNEARSLYKQAAINWKKFKDFDSQALILPNGNFDIPGSYPLLLIYSKSDLLSPSLFIACLAKKLSENRSVVTKCYEKSSHVGHYKKHPEEYELLVKRFLIDTQ